MEEIEVSANEIAAQVAARRTFAIISHPDAGKTTLTEKLLLYSGMLRTAGMVRARKGGKSTSSDWMAMEQERGISITASAMQFNYKDAVINVLDTPGHQDFSEDTYRTLTAADSAIMVLDAARGVEAQTKKLFAVCRMRGVPILTFINKLDLPSRDTLDLLHELEQVLGINTVPLNWPIGYGKSFCGVADLATSELVLFKRSAIGGAARAEITRVSMQTARQHNLVDADDLSKLEEELDLIATAGNKFSRKDFLRGQVTPVFFGSALTNFGVEPFFDAFVDLAPAPRETIARDLSGEEIFVTPDKDSFSAFVFKIQANMNPKHRDSMAFLRVVSGYFERDMTVQHHRLEKEVRLSRSYSLVARDRSTVERAFAGDVIGVTNPGMFKIGDTVSLNHQFDFPPMPQFAPEVTARVRPADVMRRKSFEKGIEQLGDEGAIQILRSYGNSGDAPIIAAVGKLQFDVLQFRLKEEYNVDAQVELLPYTVCAYLEGDPATFKRTQSSLVALDRAGRALVLFSGEWEKRYAGEQNPQHRFTNFAR